MHRVVLSVLLLAMSCGEDNTPSTPDMDLDLSLDATDSPDIEADFGRQSTCESYRILNECADGTCVSRPCRGDQVCQDMACVHWSESELRVDFLIEIDAEDPNRIHVVVAPDGFPRNMVDALRFDFGDGIAGWGEALSHRYETPGVYSVSIEVRLEGHRIITQHRLASVQPPTDHNPLSLTINQLPNYLNGSEPIPLDGEEPYVFAHVVPRDNFDIDVALLQTSQNPIELSTLRLHAISGEQEIDLTDLLELDSESLAPRSSGMIRAGNSLPSGALTLRLRAETADGQVHERLLEVETVELSPDIDPMGRPMIWLFRDELDYFTTTRTPLSMSRYSLTSLPVPNGEADFHEELRFMGALGGDEELNALYLEWIKQAISSEVYRFFGIAPDGTPRDDIELTIVWSGAPGAPDPADFDPSGDFSMMRLGGVFEGFLGFSTYSAHNQSRADDSLPTLGVASAGVLSALSSAPVISEVFKPTNIDSGEPLGSNVHDALILAAGFDPYAEHDEAILTRYSDLKDLTKNIALVLAPVIAHEMGHAMGLMPNGLPPEGFFGDVHNCDFVGSRTNSHHADLPGLNLMQAGGSALELISELEKVIERGPLNLIEIARILSLETRLSPLSRAYLQRKLTYLNRD